MQPSNPQDAATYLHAEDLLNDGQWTERTAVISQVIPKGTARAADKSIIDGFVLCFEKTEKRFVVNPTNERLLKCAVGTGKAKDWVGKSITLYASKGNWFGQQNVAAIRIRVPEGRAKPFLQPANLGKDITGEKVA